MKFFKIILPTKELIIEAQTKGLATQVAIERNLIDKFDCQDILDILEITYNEYMIWSGKKKIVTE